MNDNNSYKEMAKSSGLIACVQLFQMVFSLVRNKFVALIIGTSGYGVWSLYQTFTEMATSFSVFGLDQGGVREIAKASGDSERIGKCIFTFRLTVFILSVLSGSVVFVFSENFSEYLFHSKAYSFGIKILAFTIVFHGITKGGYAILNGIRALKYLAVSQIASAVVGSLAAIAVVWYFGLEGVAFAFSAVTVSAAILTTLYLRKLRLKRVIPSRKEFGFYLKRLMYLGAGFTIAGITATVMTLLSRSYLSAHYTLASVGIYQAGWVISNLYIGIILTAMGIDLMPRLSKISNDNARMNLLINQQIEFGMSVAAIGAVVVIILSPLILRILYSAEFMPGVSIIRWQILGVVMRVIAFPFGYAIMAKGKPIQYAFIQIVFWTLDYLLLMLFSSIWGFDALGINYFAAYTVYLTITYFACRHNHSFRFSVRAGRLILSAAGFVVYFWAASFLLRGWMLWAVCSPVFILQLLWTKRVLERQLGFSIIRYLSNRIFKHRRP